MRSKDEYLKNINTSNWIFSSDCKLDLLDYVLDENDDFWIVNEIREDCVLGYKVYEKDYSSEKKNYYTNKNYKKIIRAGLSLMPKYKLVFKPREFYIAHKNEMPKLWLDFAFSLNKAGVSDEFIGIFGSFLIGFDISKDVDFVVYGDENLKKLYQNIEIIKKNLNATSISQAHIDYQYEKHKRLYSPKCDLKEIISRNWAGVQIKEGLLSTIRFIDFGHQIMPYVTGHKKIVKCQVTEGLTSACFPRRVLCKYNGETYTIYSSMWKFQSFARDGDIVEIYGKVDEKNKIITIESNEDYIKFIKTSY